jgi:hypothetical protein
VRVFPQQLLHAAGRQGSPLTDEQGDAAAHVCVVAQDHQRPMGVRVERELAVFPILAPGDGQQAFPGGHLHIAPGEHAEFLEVKAGVQQERHEGDVPELAAALHRATQGMLLVSIEPPRPPPFLEDRVRQDGRRPGGQEARRRGPGQEAFERGELAIHAGWLQPPMIHQEALVRAEIGGGDVRGGQLIISRLPEPGRSGSS